MTSHAMTPALGRRRLRRAHVAVVAMLAVLATVVALVLQFVPTAAPGAAAPTATTGQQPSWTARGAHPSGPPTAFTKTWHATVDDLATQMRQLQVAGRARGSDTGSLVDVYRQLEHVTLAALTKARSMKPDPAAKAAFGAFVAALAAEDRDLRAVVAAGDRNDRAALQKAITSLMADVSRLADARAAVESAL